MQSLDTVIHYFIAIELALETYDRSKLIGMLKRSRPLPHEFLPLIADVISQTGKKSGPRSVLTSTHEFHMCIELASLKAQSGEAINDLAVDHAEKFINEGVPLGSDRIRRIYDLHKSHPLIQEILNLDSKRSPQRPEQL